MKSVRITYVPNPDATPQAELNALAGCYRIVLEASRKKKAGYPDDVTVRNKEGVSHVNRQPD